MVDALVQELGLNRGFAELLVALLAAFLVLHVVALGALVFIWLERKVSGRIQDRLGPTRTGGKFGWLQTLADGIKLIAKEDLVPAGADSMLFRIAPYISLVASFAAYLSLPFALGWMAIHLNTAVFFTLAVLGVEVFGVILAGYASASKWSLFGAIREAAQVVSYEVPLGMCVVVPVLIAGTMDLVTISEMQAGWFTNWFIFHDPFTFVTFWVFFTCAMAGVNRAPFDLAEAESELVAGFHTEYSGIRWSLFFMAEYSSMFVVSALATLLFLGGWNGPIPVTYILADFAGWEYVVGDSAWSGFGYMANLLGVANFIFKCTLGVIVMIWVRWTLPRLRIDQVMGMCLKYCTPIAAATFLGAVIWTACGVPFINDILPLPTPDGLAGVREGWVVEQAKVQQARLMESKKAEAQESDSVDSARANSADGSVALIKGVVAPAACCQSCEPVSLRRLLLASRRATSLRGQTVSEGVTAGDSATGSVSTSGAAVRANVLAEGGR